MSSSSLLSLETTKENAGSYECEIETEHGITKDIYHLNEKKLNRINKNRAQSHSVYFTFIHRDVRPLGRIEVLCESS